MILNERTLNFFSRLVFDVDYLELPQFKRFWLLNNLEEETTEEFNQSLRSWS